MCSIVVKFSNILMRKKFTSLPRGRYTQRWQWRRNFSFQPSDCFFLLLGVWVSVHFFLPAWAHRHTHTLTQIEMGKWVCACAATVSLGILIKRNATLSVAYNFHFIYFCFSLSSASFVFLSPLGTNVWCLFLSIAFINDRLTDRIKGKKIIINK